MASLDLYAPHIYVPPAVKWYVRTSELGTGSDTKFGKFAEERLIRDIQMVLLHHYLLNNHIRLDFAWRFRPRGYSRPSPKCSTQRIFFKIPEVLQNARPRGYGARSVFIYGGCYQTSLLPVASPSLFVFATNFCIIVPCRDSLSSL